MGSKYYYIGTLLPALSLESPSDLSSGELIPILQAQLSERDLASVQQLRLFYDVCNLRAFWRQEPFDPRGSKDRGELEEVLAGHLHLHPTVDTFLLAYEKKEERLAHFSELLSRFLQEACREGSPFLRKYFRLERDMRLVTTALRAKAQGRDLGQEFICEDPQDPLVTLLMNTFTSKELEVPEEYREIRKIFETQQNHPLALQKGLDQFRFDAVERFCDLADQFSIKRILATLVQLFLVEYWTKLDVNEGKQRVKALCQKVG